MLDFPLLLWRAHSIKAITFAAGLEAFELPLAYVRKDKFNQPIFACNNLSGITALTRFQTDTVRCALHI